MEAKLVPFALRIPPQLKIAATAMSKVSFDEWNADFSLAHGGFHSGSINDALIYLVRHGAKHAIRNMEPGLNDAQASLDFWSEVAQFFLKHPERDRAYAADFDSPMRREIEEMDAEIAAEYSDCETKPEQGFGRDGAFSELSSVQGRVRRLVDALKELRAAIEQPRAA